MRSNLEDNKSFNQHFQSGRFSHTRKVAIGDIVLTTNGSLVNFIDANGSTRNVTLPTFEEGRFYVVANVGAANNLTVRNSGGTLITTLIPGDTALMFASKTEWVALRGWAALGVFTNTVNGLVPAPNSAIPGSLFLRDDGQWGQVQVTGIVDAFKFITDGTTTAIGSGPDTFRLRSSTNKVGIVVTNNEAVFGDNANFTVNEASVDHDLLLNFFADEHVGHTGVVLTAGIGLAGGGNITASRTFDLDLNDLTTDVPVLADTFAFYDVSGLDTNKATLTTLNGILNHNALLNYVADQHVAHTGVSIITGATSGLSGGGDITASRTLLLNINGLTADVPAIGDSIPFFDLSGSDTNKATFTQVNAILDHNALLNYVANQHIDHSAVTLTAGSGLTGGGTIAASRTFDVGAGVGIRVNVDDVAMAIDLLTADTLAVGDFVPFFDISGTDHNKITIAGLNSFLDHNSLTNYVANQHIDHTAVSISTTEGIQGGGTIAATRTLKLDINGLTADATPDAANDYVTTWDASASLHKKVLITNLPGGLNITGLTAAVPAYDDEVPIFDVSASANRKATIAAIGGIVSPGVHIGCTMSTVGSSSTMSVAPGRWADAANSHILLLASTIAKTTSAWAVGTGNGGIDTSTVAANTWYFFYLIKRVDTGVVDVIFSLSANSPTLPTNYTLYRRIGAARTDGSSQWRKFIQLRNNFLWDVMNNDVSAVAVGTTALTPTVLTPLGLKVKGIFHIAYSHGTAGNGLLVSSTDVSDQTPTGGNPNVGFVQVAGQVALTNIEEFVNGASQIRVRGSAASGTYWVWTYGWHDFMLDEGM